MTIEQAGRYVREYLELLADNEKRGGRISPALLPVSKDIMLQAIKLLIAQLHLNRADLPERVDPLVRAAMFIDGFTYMALDSAAYLDSMKRRRQEMQDFLKALRLVPLDAPFYMQQVYTLIGIHYETPRTTFFQNLRSRLTLARRTPEHDTATITHHA
jgi:hypothetical protein